MTEKKEIWNLKQSRMAYVPGASYSYYISHENCTRGGYAVCVESPICSECCIELPEHLVIQRDLLNGK